MESMEDISHTDDDAAKRKSYETLFESMSRYEDAFDDANNDHRFKNEEFKTPLCRVDHKWIQIPPWNAKTHVRAFRRRVRMDATVANGGTLQGGREFLLVE
ncbi:uncharacterized protein N7503_000403 [Penicillium pulvis]|uniref:uncharacterized protein n=1 Tax=Penicillium pulvis TaxID=1562058 RepID=UPI002548109B|nr:uncharacterized protein N7503_000403 [Penicillium pulvis]KAJ5813653.1 hypothetical protein N7503_000403 [Penicillium pulvis]